jgi:hypothetical protein
MSEVAKGLQLSSSLGSAKLEATNLLLLQKNLLQRKIGGGQTAANWAGMSK